ncbi:MAG TPA: hypothetical protein VEA41_21520 [Salinarimonas sp.]|nr:hypothetical protein [Salinarimonas sp.]
MSYDAPKPEKPPRLPAQHVGIFTRRGLCVATARFVDEAWNFACLYEQCGNVSHLHEAGYYAEPVTISAGAPT